MFRLLLLTCLFLLSLPQITLAQALPTCDQGYQEVILDFDTDSNNQALPAGTIMSNQYAAQGITISAQSALNAAILYDSDCPDGCTGGDVDLGSPNQTIPPFTGPGVGFGGELGQPGENNLPHGKIIILADNLVDNNSDGLVDEPGDDPNGGKIIFNFNQDVRLLRVDFLDLDIDQNESVVISGFKNAAPTFTPVSAPNLGDNAYERIYIFENNLSDQVEINYQNTSGAVAEVSLCIPETDCLGVPGGNAVVDECGVCDGNNGAKDDCGVCFGENQAKDDCGVCFGENQAKDDCGVCFGKNECLDCLSTPNGQAQIDDCGVCNGNNQDKDDCGVCFGNNEAKDDCGVCYGQNLAKDDCGVCFGENQAKDECGICFGNGSTCIECTDVQIEETLFALDGLGERQFNLLNKAVRLFRKKARSKSALRKVVENGRELKINGWTVIWSLPKVLQTACSNELFCVSVDNTVTLNSYADSSNQLNKLIKRVVRKANRKFGKTKQGKKINRMRKQLSAEDDALVAQIPAISASCS